MRHNSTRTNAHTYAHARAHKHTHADADADADAGTHLQKRSCAVELLLKAQCVRARARPVGIGRDVSKLLFLIQRVPAL